MDPEYFEKRWRFIMKHPMLCASILGAGLLVGFSFSNLYYKSIVELSEERVRYADFANVERMKKTYEKDLEAAIKSAKEIKFSADCAWTKPICVSFDDTLTSGTARQIVLHNDVYEALCPDIDYDHCKTLDEAYKANDIIWSPNAQAIDSK